MSDIILNNTSQYIENEWLNLVATYFPKEANVSLLKAGLFGYINEIMAQEIKNSIYHKNFIYDEYLLNTASTPKSIYSFAKTNNVSVDNAMPSKLSVQLSVKESDLPKETLISTSITDNGYLEQTVISKDTIFTLNGYSFMLPYAVQIIFNRNRTDLTQYMASARYMTESSPSFPFLAINNNILKTWSEVNNGESYIFIKIDLFQLVKKTKSALVTNDNSLYNTFYKFDFEGQLSFFNISYESGGITESIQVLENNNYSLNNNEKYCYYNLVDTNILEISFSSLANSFKPALGSKLWIDVYTSDGKAGNLGLVSGISVNYAITDFANSTPLIVSPLTDCYGGADKSSLLELKSKIITKNLTRNAIVTETDLNSFFNNINNTEMINGSEVTFTKKRNDVLRKIRGAYLLMRDSENRIVPSRTIDKLSISQSQLKELITVNATSVSIPERSIICFDSAASNYFLVTKEVELVKYASNPDYLLYSCPYLINLSIDNYLEARYYETYTNLENVNLEYKYVNDLIPYKFMLNAFSIKRDSLINEIYNLSLVFNTNLSLDSGILDNIKIRGIIKDATGKAYGYFEFKQDNKNSLTYTANLSTEKYNVIVDNKLNIYNSLFALNTEPYVNPDGTTSLKNCYITEDLSLEIQVLYKSSLSSYKYGEANNMPDIITAGVDNYCTACVFYNNSTVKLFKDVTQFTDSTVIPVKEGSGLQITSIPLIEYNYFRANILQVYQIIETFQTVIYGNMNRLEDGMIVDLKFYNTHGPSNTLYTDYSIDNLTGVKQYNYLNRLDIDLNLDIYLNTFATDDVKTSISNFLIDYIEKLNKKGVIAMSNLIKNLENTFEIISFTELNSINGQYYQKIVNTQYGDSILSGVDIVPEFVNVRKGVAVSLDNGKELKKYTYSLTINYK